MLPDYMTGNATKTPQISDMFQKFALAVKAKTYELFAEEDDNDFADGLSLLESDEEVIIGQRVVVLKPDGVRDLSTDALQRTAVPELSLSKAQLNSKEYEESSKSVNSRFEESCSVSPLEEPIEAPLRRTRTLSELEFKAVYAQVSQTLVSSIFAAASSFEASYLQLQTAHAPFDEERIKSADKALVSHLQRLSDLKQFYRQFCKNPELGLNFPSGSCWEARVQENQSKLRTLGLISDRLQSDIDQKNNEVQSLRKKLGEIQSQNFRLSKRLSDSLSSSCEVSLTVQVFDTLLHDAYRAIHKFTNILTDLMRRAGWDLDLAADSVYPDVDYSEKEHNRYAFLSYVFLQMFHGFDLNNYGIGETKILEHVSGKNSSSLKKLLEHVSSNPMDVLSMDPDCDFAKFCDNKYKELIHPSMESSIFRNLDPKEAALSSWQSVPVFYNSFVKMSSSMWTLQKLAFSFDPVIEIFQVEKGVAYSVVYMEDIKKQVSVPHKPKPRVEFTVVPGFMIRKTVVQSKVYLSGLTS